MGGLPLNYLRKITVSCKLAKPHWPSRMSTLASLAQAGMMRNQPDAMYVLPIDDPAFWKPPLQDWVRMNALAPGALDSFVYRNGGPAVKGFLPTVLLSFFLIGCIGHATARFYPVQGPLVSQTPSAVYVGKVSGGVNSGQIALTANQGEMFQGRWETIQLPKKSTDAPVMAPTDNEMVPLWDSIYGNGFYVAHVLGSKFYARASLTGANGDSLKVEFYRPEEKDSQGNVNALRASIKGVAKDDKGNVYKITIS
ncbi:MAG TPA: hypothetical protein VN025_18810 [Candidatus Dormibacteraeota bacterium]|nr:hypothetical protein [Candidatus Dormibacteraeota bacterium]